jgi:hypothetical protein
MPAFKSEILSKILDFVVETGTFFSQAGTKQPTEPLTLKPLKNATLSGLAIFKYDNDVRVKHS